MLSDVLNSWFTNPLTAAAASMALFGWLAIQLRSIPATLGRMLRGCFTTTLTVYSEDEVFRLVELWLARHPSAGRSRRYAVASWGMNSTPGPAAQPSRFTLTPGSGWHLLRDGFHMYLMRRTVSEGKTGDGQARRQQTIEITTLGRSRRSIDQLLAAVPTAAADPTTVPIYLWRDHYFDLVEHRRRRPLDTVFMPAELHDTLTGDLGRFLSSEAEYARKGIPYYYSFLLDGPPGTGKSTIIFALASLYGCGVYIVNANAIQSDNEFQAALNGAGRNFIVLEDFDAVPASHQRTDQDVPVPQTRERPGVTLSGILNGIDGIGVREGRVLFITSNHPDKFDPALVRPGRIDRQVTIQLMQEPEARRMLACYYPAAPDTFYAEHLADLVPATPAAVAQRLREVIPTG